MKRSLHTPKHAGALCQGHNFARVGSLTMAHTSEKPQNQGVQAPSASGFQLQHLHL